MDVCRVRLDGEVTANEGGAELVGCTEKKNGGHAGGARNMSPTHLRSTDISRAGNQSAPAEDILRPATSSCGTPATSTSEPSFVSQSKEVS
jgi:hypothetical protein